MNKIAISAFAGLAIATTSYAGPVETSKKVVTPVECFSAGEFQIDTFASYTGNNDDHGDGFGGGLGLNYFFTRYIGLGADVNLYDGDEATWQFTGAILARYPLELGSVCLAPYAKIGGGGQIDGSTDGYLTTGAGIEFRVTPRVGVYGEGSYNFGGSDFGQARVGLRWVF